MGQSTCLGIGGDPIVGMDFADVLQMFEDDNDTEAMVMIGEIGGNAEEKAAKYIAEKIQKPVIAYIAGVTAPPGKRMGHAGAIIEGESGTAKSKIEALENSGVDVAKDLQKLQIDGAFIIKYYLFHIIYVNNNYR